MSHLVVGLGELLSGAFAFVPPSLLLYNGRVPVVVVAEAEAVAGPWELGAPECAIGEELTSGLDEVVVDPLPSITMPRFPLCAVVAS